MGNKTQIFSVTDSKSAAQKLSSFLYSRGHKKVAFISPFHRSNWSKERFEGTQDVFGVNGTIQFTLEYNLPCEFFEMIHPALLDKLANASSMLMDKSQVYMMDSSMRH